MIVLTGILAACYAMTGELLGWIGAALILVALATRPPIAYAFLMAGALPLAVDTWWSLVTPLLAVLTLLLGVTTIRRGNHAMV
jgi:hypothetical protein